MTAEAAVLWMLRLTAGRANYLEKATREETDEIRLAVLSAFRDQTFDRLLRISNVAMQHGLTDHETKIEKATSRIRSVGHRLRADRNSSREPRAQHHRRVHQEAAGGAS